MTSFPEKVKILRIIKGNMNLFFFFLFSTCLSYANITVFPTAVHFDQKKNSSFLSVKNSSDAIMTYTIEPVFFISAVDGKMSLSAKPSEEKMSIVRLLRFSPKRVTLNPQEEQVVRIMIKNDRRLTPGDYRAHVRFIPEEEKHNFVETKKKMGMVLDARVAVSIPVLLRIEPSKKELTLKNFKIYKTNNDFRFSVTLVKSEGYFPYGEFRIQGTSKGGKKTDLAIVKGIQAFKPESSFDYPISNNEKLKDVVKANLKYIETFNGGEEPIADVSTDL